MFYIKLNDIKDILDSLLEKTHSVMPAWLQKTRIWTANTLTAWGYQNKTLTSYIY